MIWVILIILTYLVLIPLASRIIMWGDPRVTEGQVNSKGDILRLSLLWPVLALGLLIAGMIMSLVIVSEWIWKLFGPTVYWICGLKGRKY